MSNKTAKTTTKAAAKKATATAAKAKKPLVLVRTYSAGVHFGTLAFHKGTEVRITNARRLWRWMGERNTLSEISQRGVVKARISEPVPEIILTQAIEIMPISEKAATTLATRWDE